MFISNTWLLSWIIIPLCGDFCVLKCPTHTSTRIVWHMFISHSLSLVANLTDYTMWTELFRFLSFIAWLLRPFSFHLLLVQILSFISYSLFRLFIFHFLLVQVLSFISYLLSFISYLIWMCNSRQSYQLHYKAYSRKSYLNQLKATNSKIHSIILYKPNLLFY